MPERLRTYGQAFRSSDILSHFVTGVGFQKQVIPYNPTEPCGLRNPCLAL